MLKAAARGKDSLVLHAALHAATREPHIKTRVVQPNFFKFLNDLLKCLQFFVDPIVML